MRSWEMPKLNLQGSDKQIKWATDIIAGVYATANNNIKRAHDKQWPHTAKWEEAFDKIISQLEINVLAKIDQASAIITHRERFSSDRILYLAENYVNWGKF